MMSNQPVPASSTNAIEHLLRESRRWPLLSAREEVQLAQRVEAGDAHARERLILSNVRLVVSIARPLQGLGVPLPDLVQEGMIGLIRSVDGFDWRRGFRFSTYATIWIRRHVHTIVAKGQYALHLPRSLSRRARRVAAVKGDLQTRLNRTPTDAELAAAADLTVDELHHTQLAGRAPIPLDHSLRDDELTTIGEMIATHEPSPETHMFERWQRGALAAAVAALPDIERAIIELRFGATDSGRVRSFAEIGRAIGRSAERSRQIHERALQRLAAKSDLAAMHPSV